MAQELLPLTSQALRKSGPGYVGGAAGDLASKWLFKPCVLNLFGTQLFEFKSSHVLRMVSHSAMGQHGASPQCWKLVKDLLSSRHCKAWKCSARCKIFTLCLGALSYRCSMLLLRGEV